MADATSESPDVAGLIAIDLPCRGCGYNLRGLLPTGRCPECGVPISASCHDDLLCYGPPTWLATLQRGAWLIVWGTVGMVAGLIVFDLVSPLLMAVVKLAGGAVALYGVWLITQPDPSGIGDDQYVNDRRIVRFCVLVGLVAYTLEVVWESGVKPVPLDIAKGLCHLVNAVGDFAMLSYFAKLAGRIPAVSLSLRARRLRWPVAVARGIAVAGARTLVQLGPPAAGGGAATTVTVALTAIVGAAVLAHLGLSVLVLILVYRLGKALRVPLELARHIWPTTSIGTPLSPGNHLAGPRGH
ncbi:MAG TPA: hypothetical protein PKK06_04050 [Phycisphaerae bacterium]|nr:hypothetical protein [Phycisphaerae bacterium]HNU44885.1 hypothetical protein [Phycisphaerae bacterium]